VRVKAAPPENATVAVEWIADSRGLVSGMRYHDGTLASLEIKKARVRVSVHPVGGGVTVFDLLGNIEFGSIGLTSGDIVVDVWAFRLGADLEPMPALAGSVMALQGNNLYDSEVEAAVQHISAQNAGRLLVSFTCARSSEFSVLADEMRVTKAGY
jgi:hypothetical protein